MWQWHDMWQFFFRLKKNYPINTLHVQTQSYVSQTKMTMILIFKILEIFPKVQIKVEDQISY